LKQKKVQTKETDNNDLNEQEVHLSTDERIILGKKRKRTAKPEEAEIDLHKFFTQNKRFEPDQASKSPSFVADLRARDYSKDEVLNFISNFLTNSTQGQSVQVQIKTVVKLATSLLSQDFTLSIQIYTKILQWVQEMHPNEFFPVVSFIVFKQVKDFPEQSKDFFDLAFG